MRNRKLVALILLLSCFVDTKVLSQLPESNEKEKNTLTEQETLLLRVEEHWPFSQSEQAVKDLWHYHTSKGDEKEFIVDLRSISDFRDGPCFSFVPAMLSGILELTRKLEAAGESTLAERCLGLVLACLRPTGERSIVDVDGASGFYDYKNDVLNAGCTSEKSIDAVAKWNGAVIVAVADFPKTEILKGNKNVIGFTLVGNVTHRLIALTESFPSLTQLTLSPEYLFQLDPHILKRLTKLQIFQGEFTDAVAKKLCECSNLQTLTFSRGVFLPPKSLDSPKSLERLKALKRLSQIEIKDYTLNDDAITAIGRLDSVKIVSLERCPMAEVSSFSELRYVRTLDLDGRALTANQIKSISKLKNLESLDLSNTETSTQSLKDLSKLKNLRVLNLKGCKLQENSYESLAKLTGLKVLDLQQTGLPVEGVSLLSSLKRLEQLKFNFPENADVWLEFVCNLKSLKELNLSNYYVSPEKLTHISRLKNLRQIVLPVPKREQIQGLSLFPYSNLLLSMKPLTDQQIECLAGLPSLRELVGGRNAITGSVFAHGFEQLEVLELPNCPVTDASIPALSRLPSIKRLELPQTQITGENISLLTQCKHLEELTVGGPAFEIKNISKLSFLGTLAKLDLRGTTFSLKALQSLQNALPKCILSPDPTFAEKLLKSKDEPQLPRLY